MARGGDSKARRPNRWRLQERPGERSYCWEIVGNMVLMEGEAGRGTPGADQDSDIARANAMGSRRFMRWGRADSCDGVAHNHVKTFLKYSRWHRVAKYDDSGGEKPHSGENEWNSVSADSRAGAGSDRQMNCNCPDANALLGHAARYQGSNSLAPFSALFLGVHCRRLPGQAVRQIIRLSASHKASGFRHGFLL